MIDRVLFLAGVFVLLTVAAGLVRILRGPTDADRLMAIQLFGTGGIAALLLSSGESAVDLALILALLSAFAAAAFATRKTDPNDP